MDWDFFVYLCLLWLCFDWLSLYWIVLIDVGKMMSWVLESGIC